MACERKAILALVVVVLFTGLASAAEDVGELIRKGVSLQENGQLEEAVDSFKAALALDRDNEEALSGLAKTYAGMSLYDLCIDTAKDGVKLEGPLEGALCATLGSCYEAIGKPGSAIRIYRRGLKREPNNAELNYGIASILATDGKSEEAIGHLETTIREHSTHASAYYLLGGILATDGHTVPAMYSYMRFFALEPNGQRASRAAQEVFRLQGVASNEQTSAETLAAVGSLVAFLQQSTEAGTLEAEQQFTREHLATMPLGMRQDGLLEPFAYALAARAGIAGAIEWLEEHPVEFRKLNRFLAQQGEQQGAAEE